MLSAKDYAFPLSYGERHMGIFQPRIYGIENNELPLVQFSMRIDGGQSLDSENKSGTSLMLGAMLKEGTKSKTPAEFEEAIDVAKGQYLAFEEVRQTGHKAEAPSPYEPLDRYAKAQQTAMIKALDNNMEDHLSIMPELTRSMVTTKEDPMSFVIKSPLMRYMSEGLAPKRTLDMDNPELEQDVEFKLRLG